MDNDRRLNQLLPDEFLQILRDRIKAGVSDAESKYGFNEEDEDSVTGALGQAISTAKPTRFQSAEDEFSYMITNKKIRGRGPGAPEKHLGADAIFQIVVIKNNKPIFQKGLPIQAKMGGGFANKTVKKQAGKLLKTTETGLILRYSDKGYTGVDVREVVDESADTRQRLKPRPKKLASILGDDFLDCLIGKQGLRYDPERSDVKGKGIWVIDTTIVVRNTLSQ